MDRTIFFPTEFLLIALCALPFAALILVSPKPTRPQIIFILLVLTVACTLCAILWTLRLLGPTT